MTRKRDMSLGARKLIRVCAGVQPGEKVLVVPDTARNPLIAEIVYKAAIEAGAETVMIVMEPGARPGAEVSEMVAAEMKVSDFIIGLTTSSLYHTRARLDACEGGARLVAMTKVTETVMMSGGIEADFEAQCPTVAYLARKINS